MAVLFFQASLSDADSMLAAGGGYSLDNTSMEKEFVHDDSSSVQRQGKFWAGMALPRPNTCPSPCLCIGAFGLIQLR
jgi:hypothetical protein